MKQTPLFDDFFPEMPEPPENPLWLNEPPQHRWLEVTQQINDHCTKQLMLTYAACFQSWLSQYTKVYITNQGGALRNADELILMTKTNTPKQQIAYGLAVIFSDDQNLSAYLSSISPELRLLLQTVITNIYVLHSDAKHIMHSTEDLFRQQRTGYYYSNEYTPRDPALGWMELRTYYAPLSDIHHYRERANYLTMNNTVRALFMPHLLPEAYRSNSSLPSLPEDTDYNVVDMEASSHAHFKLIAGLMEQDELPIKKNGVSVTDMKRVLKKVAMEEFFPHATNQYHQNMRSYAYLQLLALHHSFIKKGKTAMSYEDTLRDLISNFRTINYYLTSLLYPHVTGMRRQFSDYGKQDKLCMLLLDLMKEQPDEWYSPNDVMLKILALEDTTISAHYSILVFYPPYEEYNNNLTNDYSGRSITVDRYTQEFGYTGLQSFAMLMASLGILQSLEGRHVFSKLTVEENLTIGAYLRKDTKSIKEDMKDVYRRFPRLEERKWQLAGTLSGGEQQMLAMGRALMGKPKLMLLDEPSMGLAPLIVKEIFVAVKDINKDGTTILFVEQNSKIALATAHRGYVMQTGEIVIHDTCENLSNNEDVKRVYLGG